MPQRLNFATQKALKSKGAGRSFGLPQLSTGTILSLHDRFEHALLRSRGESTFHLSNRPVIFGLLVVIFWQPVSLCCTGGGGGGGGGLEARETYHLANAFVACCTNSITSLTRLF